MFETLHFAIEIDQLSATAFIYLVENMMHQLRPAISIIIVIKNQDNTYIWVEFQGEGNVMHLLHLTAHENKFTQFQQSDIDGCTIASSTLSSMMMHGESESESDSTADDGITQRDRRHQRRERNKRGSDDDNDDGHSKSDHNGQSAAGRQGNEDQQQVPANFLFPISSVPITERAVRVQLQQDEAHIENEPIRRIMVANLPLDASLSVDIEARTDIAGIMVVGPLCIKGRVLMATVRNHEKLLLLAGITLQEMTEPLAYMAEFANNGEAYYYRRTMQPLRVGTFKQADNTVVPASFTVNDNLIVQKHRRQILVQLVSTRFIEEQAHRIVAAVAAAPTDCEPQSILAYIKTVIGRTCRDLDYDILATMHRGITVFTVYSYDEQSAETIRGHLILVRPQPCDQNIYVMMCGPHFLAWADDQHKVVRYYMGAAQFRVAKVRTMTVNTKLADTFEDLVIELRVGNISIGSASTDQIVSRTKGPVKLDFHQQRFIQTATNYLQLPDHVDAQASAGIQQHVHALAPYAGITTTGHLLRQTVMAIESNQSVQVTVSAGNINGSREKSGDSKLNLLKNRNRTVLAIAAISSSAGSNPNVATGEKGGIYTDRTARNGKSNKSEDRIAVTAAKNNSSSTAPSNSKSGTGKNSDDTTAATTISSLTLAGSNQGKALMVYIDKVIDEKYKQMQSNMQLENDRRAQLTDVTLGQLGEKIDRSDARAEANLKETVNSLAVLIQEALRAATLDRSMAKANGGDHNG